MSVGNHNITVNYTADSKYSFASEKGNLTVSKASVPMDSNTLNINVPTGTKSPSFTINLPSGATGTLSVTANGKTYSSKLVNGSATVTVPNLPYGNNNVVVSYSGDDNYDPITKTTSVNIPKPVISAKNIAVLYTSSTKYKVRVTVSGKAVVGKYVTFKFNGKTKKVKTNKKGYAIYKLPTVKPKKSKYTIKMTYNGVTKTNKIKVNSIVKAKNLKAKKSAKVLKIKVTLKKVNKKYLKSKKVTLKFRGKTYKVKTNKKGLATFKVKNNVLKKLKVGKKYTYKVTYKKDTVSKKITIKK